MNPDQTGFAATRLPKRGWIFLAARMIRHPRPASQCDAHRCSGEKTAQLGTPTTKNVASPVAGAITCVQVNDFYELLLFRQRRFLNFERQA